MSSLKSSFLLSLKDITLVLIFLISLFIFIFQFRPNLAYQCQLSIGTEVAKLSIIVKIQAFMVKKLLFKMSELCMNKKSTNLRPLWTIVNDQNSMSVFCMHPNRCEQLSYLHNSVVQNYWFMCWSLRMVKSRKILIVTNDWVLHRIHWEQPSLVQNSLILKRLIFEATHSRLLHQRLRWLGADDQNRTELTNKKEL